MKEMVTIPRDEYDRLRAAAEDLANLQAYDRAAAGLKSGQDELIPADYVNRLLNGESPLRVYRDLRGLTQAALAKQAGVNRVTVAEIETWPQTGFSCILACRGKGVGHLVGRHHRVGPAHSGHSLWAIRHQHCR